MTTPHPGHVVYSFKFDRIGHSPVPRVIEFDYMIADEARAGFEDRLMADLLRCVSRFLLSRSVGIELDADAHEVAIYAGDRPAGTGAWTREQC